jgi:3-methyladenine DNA glycosylase AlkD
MGRCCSDGQVPLVRASYQALIRREERFAKAAVGRVLRELSEYDPSFVRDVIEQDSSYLTAESLRNASKTLLTGEQDAYVDRLRTA